MLHAATVGQLRTSHYNEAAQLDLKLQQNVLSSGWQQQGCHEKDVEPQIHFA